MRLEDILTCERSESQHLHNVSDVDFLVKKLAGIYKLLVLFLFSETTAKVALKELVHRTELEVLFVLESIENLVKAVTFCCELGIFLHLVEFVCHNHVFRVFCQIVVYHLQYTENGDVNTSNSA